MGCGLRSLMESLCDPQEVAIRTRCDPDSAAVHSRWYYAIRSPLVARPLPTANLRTVDPVLVGMTSACDLEIAEFFFGVRADPLQFRDAVNRVNRKTEPVRLVVDCQLHWRVDVPFLFVTPHVHVPMVRATIGET